MTMDRSSRADRVLVGLFDELADARTPDYLEAAIERASSRRQRPAWTLPERWFPMAETVSRPAFAPRVPWRAIGMALVILALLIVAAVFVGSRQHRPAPPFGPAANGLIAYSNGGDISTLDPRSGQTTVVVAGTSEDSDPAYSPDGLSLAFLRTSVGSPSAAKDIVVARADGSNALVITPTPIVGGPSIVNWANDSASLLVGASDLSAIWLFDATKAAQPRVVATGADMYLQPFQPPNGSAILIRRMPGGHPVLVRLDLKTSQETVLATGVGGDDLGGARWSPDGSKVLYNSSPADDPSSQRLFIVNADGTNRRQITTAPGTWLDIDAAWSPDGSQVAFTRYERTTDADTSWEVRPIGLYTLATGSVVDLGPLSRQVRAKDPTPGEGAATGGEGFDFEWAPDGRSIIALPSEASGHPVVIDVPDGTWHDLTPVVQPGSAKEAWQRLAP